MKHSNGFCSAVEKDLILHNWKQGEFDEVWVLILADYNCMKCFFIYAIDHATYYASKEALAA